MSVIGLSDNVQDLSTNNNYFFYTYCGLGYYSNSGCMNLKTQNDVSDGQRCAKSCAETQDCMYFGYVISTKVCTLIRNYQYGGNSCNDLQSVQGADYYGGYVVRDYNANNYGSGCNYYY